MFTPVQLLRNWREQRPSNKSDFDSNVTVNLFLISFLYRGTWLLVGCFLNGTTCIYDPNQSQLLYYISKRRLTFYFFISFFRSLFSPFSFFISIFLSFTILPPLCPFHFNLLPSTPFSFALQQSIKALSTCSVDCRITFSFICDRNFPLRWIQWEKNTTKINKKNYSSKLSSFKFMFSLSASSLEYQFMRGNFMLVFALL
jgi:hypothetical protein